MTENTQPYTLAQVEAELYDTYRWFHDQNPNVYPQETGHLGALWSLFDLLIEEENENGED